MIAALAALTLLAAPPDPAAKAAALEKEAMTLRMGSKHAQVVPVLRRALALRRKAGDPKPLIATLRDLSSALDIIGDSLRSSRLLEELRVLEEKHLGPDALELAGTLERLGMQHWLRGEYAEATPLLDRALAIWERRYGKDTVLVASRLDARAAYHTMRQEWHAAEQLYLKALGIREKHLGKDHPQLIGSLYQLAWLASERGRTAEAQTLYERIVRITEKPSPGSENTQATFLELLAKLLADQSKGAQAEPLFERALAIRKAGLAKAEATFGATSPVVLAGLVQLAGHYRMRKRVADAVPLLRRAVDAAEAQYGKDHLATTTYRLSYGMALTDTGRIGEAIGQLERARKLYLKTLGPAQATTPLQLIGEAEYRRKRFRKASGYFERVLALWEQRFGHSHPVVALTRERLAQLAWADRRPERAVTLLTQALEIAEPLIDAGMGSGTEGDRRAMLDRFESQLHATLSLAAAYPALGAARDLALTAVLRRKGRLLDAMADTFTALHRRLQGPDKAKLERLMSARARLARLVVQGPEKAGGVDYAKEVAALEQRIRTLEGDLSAIAPALRIHRGPATIGAVRAALPKGAALVEIAVYRTVDPTDATAPRGAPQLSAWVLGADGAVSAVPLGPAAPIDRAVAALRKALADPDSDAGPPARALDALTFAKIAPLLGAETRQVFLAPDGALNLVPFGALRDEQGTWRVQRYTFSYLTSGRDLLRLHVNSAPRSPPTVVANPAFGDAKVPAAPDAAPASETRGRRTFLLRSLTWAPLPGTRGEADALARLVTDAVVLTADKATEEAIKAVHAPRFLHIATHGFFLDDPRANENPLLRSGLVLSGANKRRSDREDGVLTALEASSLDLWGTRLVVLSACETGLGLVRPGEGVYGLRRALVIAGAETLVMSLWQVDDTATRDLMTRYYKRIQGHVARADALRQAQLSLLSDRERAHPYYWASFISSGDWRPVP